MGGVVRPGLVPTLSEAQMRNVVETKGVPDIFVQAVLCNSRFIVWILERVGHIVDRTVNEYCLYHIKEASTTSLVVLPFIKFPSGPPAMPSKTPSSSELQFENLQSHQCDQNPSCKSVTKKSRQEGVLWHLIRILRSLAIEWVTSVENASLRAAKAVRHLSKRVVDSHQTNLHILQHGTEITEL